MRAATAQSVFGKPNPNDPCFCGSGKKRKRCCREKVEDFERRIRHQGYPGDLSPEDRQMAAAAGHSPSIAFLRYFADRGESIGLAGKLSALGSFYSRTLYRDGFNGSLARLYPSFTVGHEFMDLDVANGLFRVRERVTHGISQMALMMFSATMDGSFKRVQRAIDEIPDDLVLALKNTDEQDNGVKFAGTPFRVLESWLLRRGSEIFIASQIGWQMERGEGAVQVIYADDDQLKLCRSLMTSLADGRPTSLAEDAQLWSMLALVQIRMGKKLEVHSRTLLAEVNDQFVTVSDDPQVMRAAYESPMVRTREMAAAYGHLFFKVPVFDHVLATLWLPRFARLSDTIVNESQRKKENEEFLQLQTAYIEELESDRKDANALRLTTVNQIAKLKQDVEERDNKILSLTETISSLKEVIKKKPKRIEPAPESKTATALATRFAPLIVLPQTPLDALLKVKRSFQDRLVILPEAEESVKEAVINSWVGGVEVTWRCLMSMAVHLWDLYFGNGLPKDIRQEFRERSGLDFAISESPCTKADRDLMKLRERNYQGQVIDISPHVGWGSDPEKHLRVHLHVDRENSLIVIGHCGDHMPIASTK